MDDAADDITLIEAWRDGDAAAGEQLFRRHFSAVSRFFRNKFTTGVDDLIQQTFVAMVEGQQRLRADRSFRSYLFGIAHNVMRTHLRALDRGRKFDPTSSSIAQLDPGPSTMHGEREEQRLLLRALRQIPLEHQVVLELVYWEELNAAEIAAVVGVPHSTMRSRIARARAVLEAKIEELAQSAALCQSTLDGLEQWAADVRERAAS